LIGKKGNKEASDASLTAQREALAYEREKEAKAEAAYKMRMDAWNRNRQGILARYGIGGGAGGGQMNLGALVGRGGPPMPPPEAGGMSAHGGPGMPGGMPPPQPMDLENWNDWGRYAAVPKMG
jgi:hypothetical protein